MHFAPSWVTKWIPCAFWYVKTRTCYKPAASWIPCAFLYVKTRKMEFRPFFFAVFLRIKWIFVCIFIRKNTQNGISTIFFCRLFTYKMKSAFFLYVKTRTSYKPAASRTVGLTKNRFPQKNVSQPCQFWCIKHVKFISRQPTTLIFFE